MDFGPDTAEVGEGGALVRGLG